MKIKFRMSEGVQIYSISHMDTKVKLHPCYINEEEQLNEFEIDSI